MSAANAFNVSCCTLLIFDDDASARLTPIKRCNSNRNIASTPATTHVNYTSAQHPDVAAMETYIANPPIMSGKLSNARHAPRLLNCLQPSLRGTAGLYTHFIVVVVFVAPLAFMTYARVHNDLI